VPLPKFKSAVKAFRESGDFDTFLGFEDAHNDVEIGKNAADSGISDAILPLIQMPLQSEGISFGKITQSGFDSGDFRSSFGEQIIIPSFRSVENAREIFDLVPGATDTGDPMRTAIRGMGYYSQMTAVAPFDNDEVRSVTSFIAVPSLESQGVSQLLRNQIRSDFAGSFPNAESITVHNVKGLTAEHFSNGVPDVACWTLIGLEQIRSTVDAKWGDIA